MKENNESDLEKIARKCEDLVICENGKCELRGDYWKCYMGNYNKCMVYLDYLKNNLNKSGGK